MKQYFMQGTNEPLEFGDSICFDIDVCGDKGIKETRHIDVLFVKEIIPLLVAMGVIEEREVEDEAQKSDEEKNADLYKMVAEFMQATGNVVEDQQDAICELQKDMEDVLKILNDKTGGNISGKYHCVTRHNGPVCEEHCKMNIHID